MPTARVRCDQDARNAQESRVATKDWSRASSYRCVSWSYPPRRPQRPSRIPIFTPLLAGSGVYARPPHYHDLLYRARRRKTPDNVEDDVELSSRLTGVNSVEDTVLCYEHDVGIVASLTDVAAPDERPLFCGTLSEGDIATVQRQWHDQVEQLLGGISKRLSTSFEEIVAAAGGPDSKLWDLSLLDSPELSESELSTESDPPPSTPRASPSSLSRSAKDGSIDVLQPHPTPLSATAAAFIPAAPSPPSSVSKSPSPTHEFAFPSLSADNPAASPAARKRSLLLKDGEGFYHSAEAGNESPRSSTPRRARPSADLLPAFLADGSSTIRSRVRNASRTREMVDRLRSGRWNGKKGDKASAPSLEHTPEGKATKERSTERATSSERSSPSSGMTADADGWISGPSSKTSDDGWIDGVVSPPVPSSTPVPTPAPAAAKREPRPRTQKHAHKRSSSSASSLSTAASAPPATPVLASHPVPVPIPNQAGFFPMQHPAPAAFPYALPPRTPGMSDAQYLMHIQKLQHDHWANYMRYGGAGAFMPGPYAAYPPAPVLPAVYGAK
ncbi:uncharacterized protein C8Q71DRAFT_860322 [Rhodofomes roseus]|uniref:Uncharacterized protein n=1 Tax=Rhodofomes roseus TaxID=34475 RepID=A0ABQ8K8A2_9APHY|nr:uncharacterized protein C8Q71DRAFT_860322 [Rhodofomes roseus]KAH9833528.1 hypothetical protein C8Q71DRAFT_860322 [Rhodofomes roseus]